MLERAARHPPEHQRADDDGVFARWVDVFSHLIGQMMPIAGEIDEFPLHDQPGEGLKIDDPNIFLGESAGNNI